MTADVARMPAPKAMPGWYEATGDPLDRFYWSGARWLARARFVDGEWREHPVEDGDLSVPPRPTTAAPVTGGTWDLPPSGNVGVFGGRAQGPARKPGDRGSGGAPSPNAASGGTPGSRGGVAAGSASGGTPALPEKPAPRFVLGAASAPLGDPVPGSTDRSATGSVADGTGSSGEGVVRAAGDDEVRAPGLGSIRVPTTSAMPDLRRADAPVPIDGGVPTGGPGWSGGPVLGGPVLGGPVLGGGSGSLSSGEFSTADAGRRDGRGGGGEVELHLGEPMPQRRWTVVLRGVLVLPHLVCLELAGIVVVVGVVVMWIVALATGQVPRRLWALVWGWGQWNARVNAYMLLLTDRYPTFGAGAMSYPVQLELVSPAAVGRSEVLFRAAMAWPAGLLAAMATAGLVPVGLVAWVATVVRGRLPSSFHFAFAAVVRFDARVHAFACLLTSAYPAAPLGDGGAAGVGTVPSSSGSRSVLAWCFGAAPVVYAAIAAVVIPTFIGVSGVRQGSLTPGRIAQATATYSTVARAAQQAVLSCAQGGSAQRSGAPCVAAALDQWSQGADDFAGAVAAAYTSLPTRTTGDAMHLLVDVAALGSALARTAGSATPIAMLQNYEGPVRNWATTVSGNIARLDAALSVDR